MNPLVQVQLSRLQGNVQSLKRRHEDLAHELQEERALGVQRLKEVIQQNRELGTLSLNEKAHADLQRRVADLESTHRQLREHVERLSDLAAALTESLEP